MKARGKMEFGLYLHTPFCAVKCGYCDFYSLPPDDAGDVGRVGRALLSATESLLREGPWAGRGIHTLYVGGGTPSLLPQSFFRRLLKGPVGDRLLPGAEITVEMNPESVRRRWLDALAALGVTRASVGVQSFQTRHLRFLDRAHSPGQASRVVHALRQSGIPAVGLDLIYQLPGQSRLSLMRDVQALLDLAPDHISAYGLGWEPGTRLEARRRAGECAPQDADQAARHFLHLSRTLRQAGYVHYEVSNFARPGQGARHNVSYWWEGDVLAVGPSAVSAWTEGGRRRRHRFPADWRGFLLAVEEGVRPHWPAEDLGEDEAWLEALYVGLRWLGGVDVQRLRQRFGQERVQALLERVKQLGGPCVEGARAHRRRVAELMGRSGPALPPPAQGEVLRLPPEQWLLLDEWLLRLER